MKVRKSNKKITPFGGAIPVLKQIQEFGIPQLIRKSLGTRAKQAKYGYEDVIIAWMLTNLCGGMRLDHISKLRRNLDLIPGLKLPSHDTLGRVMKSLSTEIIQQETVVRGKLSPKQVARKGRKTEEWISKTEINKHDRLNDLLISVTKAMGLFDSKKENILDMDATTIMTNCFEAKKNYKKKRGFTPMVSTIDKLPVYIEMRGGNVSPSARIQEVLQDSIDSLNRHGVEVEKVRMDGAGFNSNALNFLTSRDIKFYIGGIKRPVIMKLFDEHKDWSNMELETANEYWNCEYASIGYQPFNTNQKYRLIVLKVDAKRGFKVPKTWVSHNKKGYKFIITNDWEGDEKSLIELYNQRGTSERNFDTLKNDFGWRLPPFSNMNQNTVFLLIAALTNNVFQGLLKAFNSKIKGIRLNARLRHFIYTFMSVACELTATEIVFYDTDIEFEKIC